MCHPLTPCAIIESVAYAMIFRGLIAMSYAAQSTLPTCGFIHSDYDSNKYLSTCPAINQCLFRDFKNVLSASAWLFITSFHNPRRDFCLVAQPTLEMAMPL